MITDTIHLVYREYSDWDEYEKKSVRFFFDESEAQLWAEEMNILHEKWCKLQKKTKNKNRTNPSFFDILTNDKDIHLVKTLSTIIPEYSRRYGVDNRYLYRVESVDIGVLGDLVE